jgi:hypothetical protein
VSLVETGAAVLSLDGITLVVRVVEVTPSGAVVAGTAEVSVVEVMPPYTGIAAEEPEEHCEFSALDRVVEVLCAVVGVYGAGTVIKVVTVVMPFPGEKDGGFGATDIELPPVEGSAEDDARLLIS